MEHQYVRCAPTKSHCAGAPQVLLVLALPPSSRRCVQIEASAFRRLAAARERMRRLFIRA